MCAEATKKGAYYTYFRVVERCSEIGSAVTLVLTINPAGNKAMHVACRELQSVDLEQIQGLLKHEAPNQWNHLTPETISSQIDLLGAGEASAAVLEADRIYSVAVMLTGGHCPSSMRKYALTDDMAFIQDVVVGRQFVGKGYGSELLKASVERAKQLGCRAVYLERHEENLASAGMMRKAGFEHVETFHDPARRTSGSRKTTVMRFLFPGLHCAGSNQPGG